MNETYTRTMELKAKKLLNVKETCEYLGLGENTVRKLLTTPKNPFTFRQGNRLYANRDLLDKWIDAKSGNY